MSYDLLVIGGGVNGAGIARDAAGRGLSTVLVERADLASATSSSSSKLIHGGLRYLEQFEFRLVAEALAEREILLRIAGHLAWPARFVMPHVPELRPRWMIGLGLFLYDHLARRSLLPASSAVRLDVPPYSSGLKAALKHGFIYSDCRVDDARLVVANAIDARSHGARILARTECLSAKREKNAWQAELSNGEKIEAKAIVNAAGPWVKRVLNQRLAQPSRDAVRLVRGSHIVLPRLYEGDHAFILQNHDRRVVFMIPYGEELADLYATADVLALPSRNETFGLTILEALASGIPVVAINQGGPTDLLHARVGALAAPGDPVDFADKLARVLVDTSLTPQCRPYVAEHFSWDKTFLKLLTIYENLHKEVDHATVQ